MKQILKPILYFSFIFSLIVLPSVVAAESIPYDNDFSNLAFLICPFSFLGIFALSFAVIQLVITLISLACLVFWIWMVIDLLQREDELFPITFQQNETKLIWIILMLVIGWFGALLYYFLVYRVMSKKTNKLRKK